MCLCALVLVAACAALAAARGSSGRFRTQTHFFRPTVQSAAISRSSAISRA